MDVRLFDTQLNDEIEVPHYGDCPIRNYNTCANTPRWIHGRVIAKSSLDAFSVLVGFYKADDMGYTFKFGMHNALTIGTDIRNTYGLHNGHWTVTDLSDCHGIMDHGSFIDPNVIVRYHSGVSTQKLSEPFILAKNIEAGQIILLQDRTNLLKMIVSDISESELSNGNAAIRVDGTIISSTIQKYSHVVLGTDQVVYLLGESK